jgi:hypothetical protein
MNERIKELWSRAGGHLSQGNQHGWPHYIIDDPEKFAELIVRECLDEIQYDDGATHVDELLPKHFGFEL